MEIKVSHFIIISLNRPARWSRGQNVLTPDPAFTGSIPGTFTNFKCGLGLARGTPSLPRTIGQLLDEVADLIKKVDAIRLEGA